EVDPIAAKLDNEAAEIPMHVIGKMAELGYFGLIFPPELGGMGLDTLWMAIVTEEIAKRWLSVGSEMTRMLISGTLLHMHGPAPQRQKWLPKICAGEVLPAAAFTEPDAGSDAAAIKTRATRIGDRYSVQGEKAWCTFANRAHVLTTTVRTTPG